MDNDDDMLDLFGDEAVSDIVDRIKDDSNEFGISLNDLGPQVDGLSPETPALFARLDEAYRTGCCQRLAWSKTGAISYISSDRRRILLRTSLRNRETHQWELTDDLPEPISAPDGVCFTHIQWSRLGLDLVALDQYGNHHIYTLVFALDRLQAQRLSIPQLAQSPSPVIGIHWLPIFPQQFRASQSEESSRSMPDNY